MGKTMKYVGARVSSELAERLEALCQETERSAAYWVTKAIENLLARAQDGEEINAKPSWKRKIKPIKLKGGVLASQILIDDRNEGL